MPPAPNPIHVLLSARAADRFGVRVREALSGLSHSVEVLEDLHASGGTPRATVAFLSRDIIADSGNGTSEPLARFIDVVRRASDLAWVHANAAGADRPILRELLVRGVRVTTSSGVTAPAVALTAFGAVIALARRFDVMAESARRRAWEPLLGDRAPDEVRGQTVVIVGMGPIGQELARLCRMISMRVIGVRRSATPCPPVDRVVAYGDLASVLPEAQWLVLACPLSDLTRRLIDARALARMPRGSHVVNVGRGGVVVDADLRDALASGHIANAFLDVFEEEPLPPGSPFWTMPNVIVTPHSASHTTGAYDQVGELFLDNLARWRNAQPLRNDLTARDQAGP